MPGLGGSSTAGERKYADTMAFAAIGAGVDGLFLETHPNPSAALCDRETQLPLAGLEQRIEKYLKLHAAVRNLAAGRSAALGE
jgi:2-dehydro-3-deoxyphosphooctonate aldolase (KDO 8-P synthase)